MAQANTISSSGFFLVKIILEESKILYFYESFLKFLK